jgi:hypothetical protein
VRRLRIEEAIHVDDVQARGRVAGFTALLALLATEAPAQTKAVVGGMVTLKLTDPSQKEVGMATAAEIRVSGTTEVVQD